MTLRLALAGATLAAGFLAPSADAGCYGVQGTFVTCTANREVARQCVYTGGGTCQWVVVNAPLCVYGTMGGGGWFQTVWC